MCLDAVTLTREFAGRKYKQTVPCNKCVECKSEQQNDYVARCVEASHSLGDVWFITLTYNENSVPVQFNEEGEIDEETGEIFPTSNLTLCREDIKLWKKRVKRHYEYSTGKKLELNYIICGEYGPQTHRPHYHAMFFGLDKVASRMLKEDWESHYGYTYFKFIPCIPIDGVDQVERTARYCSKYCVKLQPLEDPLVESGFVQKPRKMTSRGLGMPSAKRFLAIQRYHLCQDMYGDYDPDNITKTLTVGQVKHLAELINNRKYNYDGKKKKLPRYLQKRLLYKRMDDGTWKATELSKACSYVAQSRIQKDFVDKIRQYSGCEDFREMPDKVFKEAFKSYKAYDEASRKEREKTIIDYNLSFIRKSKV